MVTATLMRIPRFDENSHRIKDIVESSFGLDLKSFLKVLQKQNIFELFFLTPASFSLIEI
jgi:hypothetical protein